MITYAVLCAMLSLTELLSACRGEPREECTIVAEAVLPDTAPLDDFLAPLGERVAVYYKNLETGFVYSRNAQRVFFGASISKAPYSLYVFQQADRGEVCLDEVMVFTQADRFGGSGVIYHRHRPGAEFTLRELLWKNMVYSDNVATLMLRRRFGLEGYTAFLNEMGVAGRRVRNNVFDSFMTAEEAGRIALEIYRYIESDAPHAQEFAQALLSNPIPYIVTTHPLAGKSGWTRPYARHCFGIIYTPSPFILVIFTRQTDDRNRDLQEMAEITRLFEDFNAAWFE